MPAVATELAEDRARFLHRGARLAGITIGLDAFEGVAAIAAGAAAASVALIGFGVDSVVEITSAAVVLWRVRAELRNAGDHARAASVERRAARFTGALLLALAAYVVVDAVRRLVGHGARAEESVAGIGVTAAALVVMPILGRAKLRVAAALGSRALRADAFETIACAWLALATLVGLALNAALGWWWADPAAALVLVPLIAREGIEGVRGEADDEDDDESPGPPTHPPDGREPEGKGAIGPSGRGVA